MRYLWHAFFARPDVPLLRLPWNAMAVVGGLIAGWFEPSLWGATAAGELIYLLTLASNPGFQKSIDGQKLDALRQDTDVSRHKFLSKVGGAARQRYKRLEEKRERLDQLYRDHLTDDLFADSNRDALRKLTWLFLNLLVAQRNLIVAPSSDERELQKQIASLEREMESASMTEPLRETKNATLQIVRDRLDNIQRRATSLAEVEADLARIETQFDFALEEATLRGRPAAISVNVDLTSRLLNVTDDITSDSQSYKLPES